MRKAYDWLGVALRRLFGSVINQRIPETMNELIERLDDVE